MPSVRVLTIAGHDPCGGAGLLADAATIRAHGAVPLAVPTCLTVQNRDVFQRASAVDPTYLRDAIECVFADGEVQAVKVGMLTTPASVRVVADALRPRGLPIVVDPVLASTAPGYDTSRELADSIVEELLSIASLATPNRAELDRLGGAAFVLRSGSALLATDGDGPTDGVVFDRLSRLDRADVVFENPRIVRAGSIHGTGCALSTAVAVHLAEGIPLEPACRLAIGFVRECIARTVDVAAGVVPLCIGASYQSRL